VREEKRTYTEKDTQWDEVHICDNVVSTEAHETHNREPDSDDFGNNLSR
jgi:hypothetical protein